MKEPGIWTVRLPLAALAGPWGSICRSKGAELSNCIASTVFQHEPSAAAHFDSCVHGDTHTYKHAARAAMNDLCMSTQAAVVPCSIACTLSCSHDDKVQQGRSCKCHILPHVPHLPHLPHLPRMQHIQQVRSRGCHICHMIVRWRSTHDTTQIAPAQQHNGAPNTPALRNPARNLNTCSNAVPWMPLHAAHCTQRLAKHPICLAMFKEERCCARKLCMVDCVTHHRLHSKVSATRGMHAHAWSLRKSAMCGCA